MEGPSSLTQAADHVSSPERIIHHTLRFCSTYACTLLVLWQYFQISLCTIGSLSQSRSELALQKPQMPVSNNTIKETWGTAFQAWSVKHAISGKQPAGLEPFAGVHMIRDFQGH